MTASEEGEVQEKAVRSKGSFASFRAFVERHDGFFTTLGALIVFFGFYAKEDLRERAKDIAGSVNQAQTAFRIEKQLLSLESELRASRRLSVDLPGNDVSDDDASEDPRKLESDAFLSSWNDTLLNSSLSLDDVDARLEIGKNLLTQLPRSSGALSDDAKKYSDDSRLQYEQFDHLQQIYAHIRKHKSGRYTTPALRVQFRKVMKPILSEFALNQEQLENSVSYFLEQLLEEAEKQKKVSEHHLEQVTKLSYCLFGVGWALGFMGKLWKLPALGGSD